MKGVWTMKVTLLVLATMMGALAFADTASATILIDFTRNDYGDNSGGAVWDNVDPKLANPELSGWNLYSTKNGTAAIVDSDGNAAGNLTESVSGGVGHWGETFHETPPGGIPQATALVARYFAVNAIATYTFDGLAADSLYQVTAYAAANDMCCITEYEGDAGSTLFQSQYDYSDDDGFSGTFNVTSDSSGVASITVGPASEGVSALVNALRLEIVPEPSTLGLLGLGSMMLIRRRTRKSA